MQRQIINIRYFAPKNTFRRLNLVKSSIAPKYIETMQISYCSHFEIQHGDTLKESMQCRVLPLDFMPPKTYIQTPKSSQQQQQIQSYQKIMISNDGHFENQHGGTGKQNMHSSVVPLDSLPQKTYIQTPKPSQQQQQIKSYQKMKISYGGHFEIQHGGTVKQNMQSSVVPLDLLPPKTYIQTPKPSQQQQKIQGYEI